MKSRVFAWSAFAVTLVACAYGTPEGEQGSPGYHDGMYAAQAGCDGLGDDCIGGGVCCAGMQCGFGSCCVSHGQVCSHDDQCCSRHCKDGVCSASAAGEACAVSSQCESGLECDVEISECKVLPGGYCRNEFDCATDVCAGGTCACGQQYALCTSDADCCTGELCLGVGYCDVP